MENPDIIASDVHVHLDLEKKNDSYDCTFTCKGLMQVPCDRCLDPIDIDVDTTYHITVKYGEDYNDETDDLLIIPQSDTYINVAYMLYDTLVLTIPLRHVHPLGKCNRAMSSLLKKHRAPGHIESDGDDDEMMDEMIEEVETEQMQPDTADDDDVPTDPRWDELKKLK